MYLSKVLQCQNKFFFVWCNVLVVSLTYQLLLSNGFDPYWVPSEYPWWESWEILDYDLKAIEFELQSYFYVHFQKITFEKDIKPP